MRPEHVFGLVVAVLMVASCESQEEDPAMEACEHLQEDATPVMAGAEAGAAPMVAAGHSHYEVTFSGMDGSRSGMVSFSSTKQQYLNVFLNADVPLQLSSGMSTLTPSRSEKSGPCPEVKASYVFALAPKAYVLAFGPGTADKVGLVLITDAHLH